MILVPLTRVSHLLALDPKTLRRWMKLSHLSTQPHPTDARLKCLTSEQVQQLATAHHRTLPTMPGPHVQQPTPAHVVSEPVEVSPHLDSLTKQLDSLQGQIALLQHQLTLLTEQLQEERGGRVANPSMLPDNSQELSLDNSLETSPDNSQGLIKDNSLETSSDKSQELIKDNSSETSLDKSQEMKGSVRVASADRRKHPHVLPLVEYGALGKYIVICPEHGLLDFSPDSLEWFAWLSAVPSFRFVGKSGHFTAHRGTQCLPTKSWRASRQIRNRSYNHRLVKTESLTIAVLEQAAAALQVHLI